MSSYKHNGFTLIELSIVVVIIALIVVGVVAGQSLVLQAKLRTVSNELNLIKGAYIGFFLKYNYVPGDMPNAYQYFGTKTGCTDALIFSSNYGCNGNGDGKISNSDWSHIDVQTELYKAWQFLAADGFIPGAYNGTNVFDDYHTLGKNVPGTSFNSKAGYMLHYTKYYTRWVPGGGLEYFEETKPTNYLLLNTFDTSNPSTKVEGPVFTTEQLYGIDKKIDDGLPHTGILKGFTGSYISGTINDDCAPSFSGSNAYDLTHESVVCVLKYQMDR